VDIPPPHFFAEPNWPGWGWAAHVLSFVEQDAVFRMIDFSETASGPAAAAVRVIDLGAVYSCPADRETGVFEVKNALNRPHVRAATISYAACYGEAGLMTEFPDKGAGLLFRASRVRIGDVGDGTHATLAVGERAALFVKTPWVGVLEGGTVRTTPNAPVYRSVVHPASTFGMARIGRKHLNDPWSEPYEFFSPHGAVVNFAFADGSVHALTTGTAVDVLRALSTRAGGEVVSADW
jgi:prepilin-type processing-associated H-X9-DG protein